MAKRLQKSLPLSTGGKAFPPSSGRLKPDGSLYGNVVALDGMTIPEFWNSRVPHYRSVVLGAGIYHLIWDRKYAGQIRDISPKRWTNRLSGYLDSKELDRASRKLSSKGECSIRFGAEKQGHGYSGERGDFCLVGGVVRGSNLSIFYRALELIGGFAYDLTLIDSLERYLEREFKTVTIYTTKAFVFALKGNSNEKLYPKLKEIFKE